MYFLLNFMTFNTILYSFNLCLSLKILYFPLCKCLDWTFMLSPSKSFKFLKIPHIYFREEHFYIMKKFWWHTMTINAINFKDWADQTLCLKWQASTQGWIKWSFYTFEWNGHLLNTALRTSFTAFSFIYTHTTVNHLGKGIPLFLQYFMHLELFEWLSSSNSVSLLFMHPLILMIQYFESNTTLKLKYFILPM